MGRLGILFGLSQDLAHSRYPMPNPKFFTVLLDLYVYGKINLMSNESRDSLVDYLNRLTSPLSFDRKIAALEDECNTQAQTRRLRVQGYGRRLIEEEYNSWFGFPLNRRGYLGKAQAFEKLQLKQDARSNAERALGGIGLLSDMSATDRAEAERILRYTADG